MSMEWNIITDSSCDMMPDNEVSSVPFVINIGEKEFIDDELLDVEDMLYDMEKNQEISHTSCPSPQRWIEQFEKAEKCIAITISSKLSGSMNSAEIAKNIIREKFPQKKIAILDSLSTGPKLVICVKKIKQMIKEDAPFDKIVADTEHIIKNTRTVFALSSFDNLVKNGRMTKLTGIIAKKIGMWGIGIGTDDGTIKMKGKTRGSLKVLSMLIDDMKEHEFKGGTVVISHCKNINLAVKLRDKIRENWQNSDVSILPTRGLCSFYAERGGLILSY